jgi:DNA-binding PadR family transcriptional regulator
MFYVDLYQVGNERKYRQRLVAPSLERMTRRVGLSRRIPRVLAHFDPCYIMCYYPTCYNTDVLLLRANCFHVLVALAQEGRHGSAIAQDVLQQTNGELRLWPATLYRTLDELVTEGLIEELTGARHPEGESQRKRFYQATALGRRELAESARRLARYAGVAEERLMDAGA